eukprot:9095498-Alexandrium_andersonii.AAC.1
MSASLVGSEMCIRDSPYREPRAAKKQDTSRAAQPPQTRAPDADSDGAVSYTHLTLPTICSV